ncbi:hypothetical protein C1H46_042987 [Malus baccata]|uniref:Beta-glucosidase n=1 Tax=Malus baccata TaxID=106549 RepID=A0A540KB79_MALBA|nr:hypothetical protein C1H46_042987 [Malus baccata]
MLPLSTSTEISFSYMEPLVYGDYPKIMRLLAKRRIPTFTVEEKKLMKGSFDFIGVNYYTARFGRYLPRKPGAPIAYSSDTFARAVTESKLIHDLIAKAEKDRVLIGPKAQGIDFIYSYPQGLQKLLEFVNQNYQCPTVYITENGITEAKLDKSLKDPHRIQYILQHLYRIKMAMNAHKQFLHVFALTNKAGRLDRKRNPHSSLKMGTNFKVRCLRNSRRVEEFPTQEGREQLGFSHVLLLPTRAIHF